jgi:probable rRNA maturation factor
MKVYIENRQRRIQVSQQKIENLLRKALRLLRLPEAELSILLVNDRRMRMLNSQYRGIDRTTDVLSFPQCENPPLPPFTKGGRRGITNSRFTIHESVLGDIVINLHKAERQAAEYGLTLNEELKRLLIHGLLHLAGYDHEKGGYAEKKMRDKTRDLLARLRKI